MLFEEIFLEKADLQKFQMFRVLKSAGTNSFTINDISEQLHLSYQQTYNTFQDLLQDMQTMNPQLDSTLNRHELLSQHTFKTSLERYRLFLLEQSLVFQFIDYLVQEAAPSVSEFCEQHFVSKSTLLRKSAALKRFMLQYSLRFSYTDLKIVGDECNIRYFLFIVYWIGFHGMRWPLHHFSESSLQQSLTTVNTPANDTILTLQKRLLLGIMRVRITNGYLIHNNNLFKILTAHNPSFEQLSLPTELFNYLSARNRQRETEFFFFAQFSLIPSATTTQQRAHQLTAYLTEQKSPLWQLTVELLGNLSTTYKTKLTVTNEPTLTYNILRLLMTTTALQGNYPKVIDFYQPDLTSYTQTQLYQYILAFLSRTTVTQNAAQLYHHREQLATYLCYLLQPKLHHFEDHQMVRIWLVAENNDRLTDELQRFLKFLKIAQIMQPPAQPTDADLILSTIDIQAPLIQQMATTGIPILHWNLEAQDTNFFQLYTKIKTLYTAKQTTTRSN
ncbi:helix-turn-helix domain-containing protein [Loigolactobacillus coryniformis]|uniref:helix-turn-helix domain-containing protein n=1 Tax=Loigolactobacillus coryniformis TaxID=1610 RepID=UPI002341EE4F|nr:helix-turn-helix domain-containing protein [Loigolactobacillus coryniformis]MDC4185184.1 helix-turn-helix domain-containing protein [Loigolactobacillus coryniformis]